MGSGNRVIIDKTPEMSLCGHLIFCAWDDKVVEILEYVNFRANQCGTELVSLILTGKDNAITWERISGDKVYRVVGDPTDESVLRLADVEKSHNIIILADERAKKLADAKSILTVLALKSISKRAHICVEAVDSDSIRSLKLARADHIISIPDLREKLLAQSAITHYVSRIYRELFDRYTEQNIFSVPVQVEFVGKSFRETSKHLYEKGAILLALWDEKTGKVHINPPGNYQLHEYDVMMIITNQKNFDFSKLCRWA